MEFTKVVLNPGEADIMVRSLKPIPIDKVGTAEWKEQRAALEQLNMCAHSNATLKKDDFIRSYLIEHEKFAIVLHELLTMEVWRQRVFPGVSREISSNPSGVYMYCYYEAIILNLMECTMYFEESVMAFGDDLPELIDYLWRQVSGYCANGSKIGKIAPAVDPKTAAEDLTKHLESQMFQLEAARAMTSLSCLWFIVERINELPMSVSNNILQKNDLVLGLAEVMVQQIWLRRGEGKIQKFVQGAFKEVAADDAMRICVPEAHTWFILHKLLCDREARKKYTYTSSKKEIIMRIKRNLHEAIVDQIPVLVDVQRALEELSFLEPPSGTEEKFKSTLIIEQVPRIMSSVDHPSRNWNMIVRDMSSRLMDPSSRRDDAARLAKIFDAMFDLEASRSDASDVE